MKMYNAPTIEAVELNAVDVIATSGGNIGENTASYNLKATTNNGDPITYTDKGQAWQDSWNN